ncbi:MFS transporter [Altererythrobacter confluentis]|uniref:MFS transporter n=1 Tax=Allopontixanthobacter confluentis TaxID=1849021 RepID=A0A6L7GCN1_9SPHN|nr:MFS transporter [Allopontixanthobacter confluentis]MXP13255.1 MFS transporter [Allopontixanthobacter confluentis]
MNETQVAPKGQRAIRMGLIALIFFGTALNYLDRQVLALLKPMLQADFQWTDQEFAHFGSSFQIAAAFSLLGVGWFIDKVGVRWGYGVAVAVWSLAGMAHALASSVQQFVAARVTLAVAEAVNTPAAIKAAATYLPVRERSVGLGVINSASNIGAIVAPLAVPVIALTLGWQAAFLITGALGFVWLLFWWLGTSKLQPVATRLTAEDDGEKAPPWRALIRDRRTLAVIGAKTLTDLVWWFILFWAPDFFARQFNLGQGEIGYPTAIVYVLAAAGALSSGFLFPMLLGRGMDANRARKTSMFAYALLILPLPLALYAPNQWAAAMIIGLGLFAHQGFSTNIFGMTADIVPARQVGSVIAMGALAGNLSGAGMLEFAGWSLDSGYGYTPMFLMSASAYLLALGWIHLMQPRLEVVNTADKRPE